MRKSILDYLNEDKLTENEKLVVNAARVIAQKIQYPDSDNADITLSTSEILAEILVITCGVVDRHCFELFVDGRYTQYRGLIQIPQRSSTTNLQYMKTLVGCTQNLDLIDDKYKSRIYLVPPKDDSTERIPLLTKPFVNYPLLEIEGNFGINNNDLETRLDKIYGLIEILV